MRSKTCSSKGLNLEIEASETAAQRDARARVDRWHEGKAWIDQSTFASCCAPTVVKKSRSRFRFRFRRTRAAACRSWWPTQRRLSQFEARELQVQPLQTTGLPQMIRVLNSSRKNNRLYVRLVTRDGGAVVKGEPLAALPSSVLAVMESDRNGGSFRPLQSALLGEWEITAGYAVTGSKTLTLPLEE